MIRLVLLFNLLILLACNNNAGNSNLPDSTTVPASDTASGIPDTIRKQDTLAMSPGKESAGIYQALLPCADCKGWRITLALYPDGTYRMENEKWEPASHSVFTGEWLKEGQVLQLMEGSRVIWHFTAAGDSLFYQAGKEKVFMQPAMDPYKNKVWKQKGEQGLEFYGIGTEPFWNIEIDEEKQILFRLSDWEAAKTFDPVKASVFSDSLVYTTAKNSDVLRISIHPRFCSDGMSDHVYPNEVRVQFNGQTFKGCGLLFKR